MAEELEEPISLVGVDAENVGQPRGDGTRGSALYAVPIKLDRKPSARWARLLPEVWNHPPQSTTMHRPAIARVLNDTIVLDGTTVEEVRDVHAATLKLVVDETNRRAAEEAAKWRESQRQVAEERSAHEQNIRDVSSEIRFDD